MADNSERRQTEKVEAARHRAENAQTTRVTRMVADPPTLTRSRYSTGVSVQTLPSGMIDHWPGSSGNVDTGRQQEANAPTDHPSDKPAGQQSKDR